MRTKLSRQVLVLGLLLLVPATTVSAAPPSIDTSGATLYNFGAIEGCPDSTFGSSWAGTTGGDIALGDFGQNGKVTGGDAVLVISVDLGSAPVTQLIFPGWTDDVTGQSQLVVNSSQPTASGTLNGWEGANWNNGFGFQPILTTKSEGAGTAVVRFALLTKSNQSWAKAPGVTVELNIVVGRCLGAINGITFAPLTIGGGYAGRKG